MPRRAKRPCKHPGCPGLADAGQQYCAEHAPTAAAEQNRRIDSARPSAYRRGYDGRWQRVRRMKLSANPLCEECLQSGLTVPAAEVDHITPLAAGGTHAMSNLRSLCKPCHSRKTMAELNARGRGIKSLQPKTHRPGGR